MNLLRSPNAGIAQLGERQTEDLKVPGSIPGHGSYILLYYIIMVIWTTSSNNSWISCS